MVDIPETRYTKTSDGVHIAYQVLGDGPFDLVLVTGYVSHVELAWDDPEIAAFLRALASFSRLILFDRRGLGLSDPVQGAPTIEDRMQDLRAVMDAAGSERGGIARDLGGRADVDGVRSHLPRTRLRTSPLRDVCPHDRGRRLSLGVSD